MVKSRDGEGAGKKPKGRAQVAGAPKASDARNEAATTPVAIATPPAGAPARSTRPTRRQVRQIARLVGRLEALGELEARRRRQLQGALEKGRKTKRHRQQVDRAAGRVGELIDRLRTLAHELDSPVPSSAPSPPAAPGATPGPKPAPKRKTERAPSATARKTEQAAPRALAKPATPRSRSKPTTA